MYIYISFYRESKVKEHDQENWRADVKLVVTVWVSSLTAILSYKYYWLEI
jgi:Tfp pilus assembly protein PilO